MKKKHLTLISNEGYPNKEKEAALFRPPPLIGVGGLKRSGKDSVCNVLAKVYGHKKLAFASALRDICRRVFLIPLNYFTDDELKEKPFETPMELTSQRICMVLQFCFRDHNYQSVWKNYDDLHKHAEEAGIFKYEGTKFLTPRHILQIVGTELIRNCITSSFHANSVAYQIHKDVNSTTQNKPPLFCVSDCRFPNERELVRSFRGVTILITSPTDTRDCIHPSEVSVGDKKEYDLHFHNVKEGLDKLEVDFIKFLEDNIPSQKV